MTYLKFNYLILDENYFTLEELRDLSASVGAENITNDALFTLGKFISDYGRIITQVALKQSKKTSEQIFDSADLKDALENIAKFKSPQVYYLWIITGNGTCLYSRTLSDMQFPDAIFSGMLIGMHILAKELTGRPFEMIDMQDLALYLTESSTLVCALLSKRNDDVRGLNKMILAEFIDIFGKKLFESAVDVNQFKVFDKVSRAIIRDWPFIKSDISSEMRKKVLVEADSIETELVSGFKSHGLESAMNEIRSLDIFQVSNFESTEKLEKMIEKRFQFSESDKNRFKINMKSLIEKEENDESD